MKKVLSFVLCLSMVFTLCAAFGLVAGAEGKTVTATVTNGSVNILTDKLALLCDGNDAASATAFGDAGLVAFENTGFTHTDGVDAAVEATVEFVLDLGAPTAIGGAFMTFFKDSNSMIALPSVMFEGSADGDCWYNLNGSETSVIAPAADAAEGATATIKCDFTTRAVFNVRYIKATATFKNGWIFAGEIGTIAGASGVEAVDPAGPYAYVATGTAGDGTIAVFGAGEYDLTTNEAPNQFKNSQLIHAKKAADGNYYEIVYSKVNPWPDGHTGTQVVAEDEILISIVTGGVVNATKPEDSVCSMAKWAVRGLGAGDIVVLDEENGQIYFYGAGHTVAGEEPEEEEKIPATAEDIGIMLANNVEYEGVVGIHTVAGTNFNAAWRAAALLQLDEATGYYKVIATHPSGATGPNWTLAENQIIVEANTGNNWPALFETATSSDWFYADSNAHGVPYSECPNFCSDHVTNWYNVIGAMQVGTYYELVGIDVANPVIDASVATDPEYLYTAADYVTYSFLTVADEIDVSMMGQQPAESGFDATITGNENWSAAGDVITVDIEFTVPEGKDALSQIMFNLYFDATQVELALPEALGTVVTAAPGDSWKADEDTLFVLSEVDGYTCLTGSVATVLEQDTESLKAGDKVVVTLSFTVLEGAEGNINFQLSHTGLNGYTFADPMTAIAGTGSNLVVAQQGHTGDMGIYAIAALALVALIGTAVVIKKRA